MAPIFARQPTDDAPPAPPITAAPPIFSNPQMPDDVQSYPNQGGPGEMVMNVIHSLFTLPQRAIDAATEDVQPGNFGNPDYQMKSIGPAVETAMNMMGGGLGGAEVKAGETALGAGPIRKALPMDEASRMARAADQGYTIDAYKGGQPYDWHTMPDTDWKGNVIAGTENRVPQELTSLNTPGADHAGFFSHDPEVANRFAAGIVKDGGAVWPTKLKFDNPVVIDAQGKPAAAFQFESLAKQHGTVDEMNAFRNAFKGDNDGVILKNTKDEGDVYVPRHPDQIRSRFAAFDPANKGSGLLMGGLAGAAIPPLAAPIFAGNNKQ